MSSSQPHIEKAGALNQQPKSPADKLTKASLHKEAHKKRGNAKKAKFSQQEKALSAAAGLSSEQLLASSPPPPREAGDFKKEAALPVPLTEFTCSLCGCLSEMPTTLFDKLIATQQRIDPSICVGVRCRKCKLVVEKSINTFQGAVCAPNPPPHGPSGPGSGDDPSSSDSDDEPPELSPRKPIPQPPGPIDDCSVSSNKLQITNSADRDLHTAWAQYEVVKYGAAGIRSVTTVTLPVTLVDEVTVKMLAAMRESSDPTEADRSNYITMAGRYCSSAISRLNITSGQSLLCMTYVPDLAYAQAINAWRARNSMRSSASVFKVALLIVCGLYLMFTSHETLLTANVAISHNTLHNLAGFDYLHALNKSKEAHTITDPHLPWDQWALRLVDHSDEVHEMSAIRSLNLMEFSRCMTLKHMRIADVGVLLDTYSSRCATAYRRDDSYFTSLYFGNTPHYYSTPINLEAFGFQTHITLLVVFLGVFIYLCLCDPINVIGSVGEEVARYYLGDLHVVLPVLLTVFEHVLWVQKNHPRVSQFTWRSLRLYWMEFMFRAAMHASLSVVYSYDSSAAAWIHIFTNLITPVYTFNLLGMLVAALFTRKKSRLRIWFEGQCAVIKAHKYRAYGSYMKELFDPDWRDPKKCDPIQTLDGIGFSGYRPIVFANNKHNLKSAITARALTRPAAGDNAARAYFVEWVWQNRERLYPPTEKPKRLQFDVALRKSGSSLAAKEKIREGRQELISIGSSCNRRLPPKLARMLSVRDAFVKCENNNYANPYGELSKAARLINKMNDMYAAAVLQDEDYACQFLIASLDGSNGVLGASGRGMAYAAAYLMGLDREWAYQEHDEVTARYKSRPEREHGVVEARDMIFLVDDMSAFDSSRHRMLKESDQRIFVEHFRAFGRRTQQLRRESMAGRAKAFGKYKFEASNLFQSGDGPTLDGNNNFNATLHLFGFCHDHLDELPISSEEEFLAIVKPSARCLTRSGFKHDDIVSGRVLIFTDAQHGSVPIRVSKTQTFHAIRASQFVKSFNLAIRQLPEVTSSIRALVTGDDWLARIPRAFISNRTQSMMLRIGVKSDTFYTTDPYLVEFCSMRLIPHPTKPTFCYKTGRVMAKAAYFVNPPTFCTPEQLVRGTALSMYAGAYSSPLLRAYFDRLLALTEGVDVSHLTNYFQKQDKWKMNAEPIEIDDLHEHAFWHVYGLSPDDMPHIQALLSSARLATEIEDPVISHVLDRDTDAPDIWSFRRELPTPTWGPIKVRPSRAACRIPSMFLTYIVLAFCILSLSCGATLTVSPENRHVREWTSTSNPAPVSRSAQHSDVNQENTLPAKILRYTTTVTPCAERRCVADLRLHHIRGENGCTVEMSKSTKQNKQTTNNNKNKKQTKITIVASKSQPKMLKLKGSGDYELGQTMGGLAGSALGPVGRIVGTAVGGLIHKGISKFGQLLGFGDYRERTAAANTLYKSGTYPMKMGAMNVQFNGGPPRIQHREYIGNVLSSVGFTTKVYRIQPGLTGPDVLFPWLSQVAGNFQQYALKGCILEYVSTSSEYTVNTALGSVMMSTVYDAEGKVLTTQSAVDNNEYTTIDKPSNSFIHPLECDPRLNPISVRYVRTGNSTTTAVDDRFADVGLFQVSTVGQPTAGAVIGEIWCTYDIELMKPQLVSPSVGSSWMCSYTSTPTYAFSSAPAWFFDNTTINAGSSLPVTAALNSNSITLPVGYDGNFLVVANRNAPIYNGTTGSLFAGEVQLAGLGGALKAVTAFRDVSGLTSLVSTQGVRTASINPTQPLISNFSSGTLVMIINALGGTTTDRTIQLSSNVVNNYGGTVQNVSMNLLVTHLDNDIKSPVSGVVAKFQALGLPDEFISQFMRSVNYGNSTTDDVRSLGEPGVICYPSSSSSSVSSCGVDDHWVDEASDPEDLSSSTLNLARAIRQATKRGL